MNETATDFFARGVQRHKMQSRIASLVMLAIAVGGGAWGLSEADPGRAMARMIAYCALGFAVFVVVLVASFLPHRGLAALHTPERIVWIYGVSQHGYIHRLMIGLDDGKLRSLPLPHHSEADRGLALLVAMAPTATTGFSEPLRVAFKGNPRSLVMDSATK